MGSTENACSDSLIDARTVRFQGRAMGYYEGLTVAVGFQKGVVAEPPPPTFWERYAVPLVGETGHLASATSGPVRIPHKAPPDDGDVYQLWGKVDGAVLSLGTFGETGVVPFSVDPSHIGDIELFAVTEEKAPGVVASTQEPIMAGTV